MVTTAIYTIAKNEAKNVDAFMESCKGADLIVVGDTGSNDDTVARLKSRGAKVIPLHVSPWRFDIARNAILSILPLDVQFCMPLDLDERLPADWLQLLNKNWNVEEHDRLSFRYVHSFNEDGSPSRVGMKDFGHSRQNYVWRHAVHENIYYVGEGQENVCHIPELVVGHHQDPEKSRESYTELLEVECNSPTVTPRHMFWLAREHFNNEAWLKVLEWGDKFLDQEDTWYVERAHIMRYMAKAFAHCGDATRALASHFRSIETAPAEREVWVDLAWYQQSRDQWAQCYGSVMQAFTITHRPEHYLTTNEAWGSKIHELAGLAAYRLEMEDAAAAHIKRACHINPAMQESILTGARRIGIKV